MNTVIMIGRLTRDPELRYIPNTGKAVANFDIAVDRQFSKEKETDFFKALTEELEENGEDFEVTIFDNYCGENRDYKIFKSCFLDWIGLELSEEIENL